MNILKKLDHPNIIRVYEFQEDKTYFYIISDLFTGGELLDLILDKLPMDEQTVSRYFKQLISAVIYIHKLKIVHADLKLENILLDSHSEEPLLKVIDFSSAAFCSNKKLTKRTGTRFYMAPEVFSGKYDSQCDLWSCGVILYILLARRMPFGGNTEEEIINSIKGEQIKLDGEEWAGRSERSKDLVKQLLQRNPRKRLTGFQAFSHPWLNITEFFPLLKPPLYSDIIKNLYNFRPEYRLQRVFLRYIMSHSIQESELKQLNQVFSVLDAKGEGQLSSQDLYTGLKKLQGEAVNCEDTAVMTRNIGTDNNGLIDYSEFLVAASNKETLLSRESLDNIFRSLDTEKTGKISAEGLKTVFETADDSGVWEELIQEADQNGDGMLDIKEFQDIMLRLV